MILQLDEMKSAIDFESKIKAGWLDCFKPQRMSLYRTLLGMTLQMFQQLTGANYFFYVSLPTRLFPDLQLTVLQYGATIFTSVGIEDSFVTQIILGAVNFVCTFGGMYVMEKVRFITRDTVNAL